MQVRKFEAKTMKDALELVKQHLGPEAIILSAKDNSKGFGLMGERSVEVTAAVSEETLRKKKAAETKMRETTKERYAQSSARVQKQFIQRSNQQSHAAAQNSGQRPQAAGYRPQASGYNSQTSGYGSQPQQLPPAPRPPSAQRYIDINDEESIPNAANQRVKDAALRARTASALILTEPGSPRRSAPAADPERNADVHALEAQIVELKSMIERFQKVPQNIITTHPGAEEGVPFELSPAFHKLRQAGLETTTITNWLNGVRQELDRETIKKSPLVDAWLVQKILRETSAVKDPSAGRYHVFLGATAQGKTSTLVKMASHLLLREKKRIALVSTDCVKVGAADQLRIYAQILNVPFAVIRNQSEWAMLEERVKDVHHILVDAPGMNLKTMEEIEWLKNLLPPAPQRRIHFVQSALARDEECFDLASRYRMIGFDDVIFTRLDESVQHGLILNFQKHFQTQLHSFGTGPRIPEDYEWATKERMADLIFKISKLRKREITT